MVEDEDILRLTFGTEAIVHFSSIPILDGNNLTIINVGKKWFFRNVLENNYYICCKIEVPL